MKRLFIFTAAFLIACQPSSVEVDKQVLEETSKVSAEDLAVKSGAVRLRLQTPVSEPFACIFPIEIQNGLTDSTSVTMIGFNITGAGDDAKGNMFAPVAEAGSKSVARVIVEGQSCEAYDTLMIPEIRCTSGENDCAEKMELLNGGGLKFAQTG